MVGGLNFAVCICSEQHIMQVWLGDTYAALHSQSASFLDSVAYVKMLNADLDLDVQARQHAKQARLNDTLAAALQSQSDMASLILLPVLGLLLAAASPPPLTMADLLLPAILPAKSVAVVLLAAAAACSMACLVISRGQDRR